MNTLTAVLKDLAEDKQKKKALGLGDDMLAKLISQATNGGPRIWAIATVANTDHLSLAVGLGVFASAYRDSNQVNRPTCLRYVNGEIWVGSTYRRIARYDTNGSFLGYWTGIWAEPDSSATGYAYPRSFAVDETNDRIYIAMEWRHRVRAFRLSTGEFLWEFGDGTAGHLWDNQLWSPMDVETLPNDNVLITSYSGYGEQNGTRGINHGHVTELNGETGVLVACRIMYAPDTTGNAWDDACSNPIRARVLSDGLLYVSMYGRNHVGVWNPETWEYVTSYSKPRGVDIASIKPRGVTLNAAGDELIVVANGPKKLVAVGKGDHDYHWHVGVQQWDDKSGATNNIGEFQDVWDVLHLDDSRYAVADYGNNRVMIVPNQGRIQVPYKVDIPEGYKIVHAPEGYDTNTHELSVPINDLAQVGNLNLLLEKKPE